MAPELQISERNGRANCASLAPPSRRSDERRDLVVLVIVTYPAMCEFLQIYVNEGATRVESTTGRRIGPASGWLGNCLARLNPQVERLPNPTFLLLSANFHVLPQTQCSVSTQWRYPKSGAACRRNHFDTETALNAEFIMMMIPEILS